MLNNQSHFVSLTGTRPVGKTAIAVATYKSVISSGKQALWLAEYIDLEKMALMSVEKLEKIFELESKFYSASRNQAKKDESFSEADHEELNKNHDVIRWRDYMQAYRQQIKALLTSQLDVLFLDQSTLKTEVSFILLQEAYQWYIDNLNKGLFITASCKLSNLSCHYAENLAEKRFDYPPFLHYDRMINHNRTVVDLDLERDSVSAQSNYSAFSKCNMQ